MIRRNGTTRVSFHIILARLIYYRTRMMKRESSDHCQALLAMSVSHFIESNRIFLQEKANSARDAV